MTIETYSGIEVIVTYSIKEMESGKVHHKIPESLLAFAEETSVKRNC